MTSHTGRERMPWPSPGECLVAAATLLQHHDLDAPVLETLDLADRLYRAAVRREAERAGLE